MQQTVPFGKFALILCLLCGRLCSTAAQQASGGKSVQDLWVEASAAQKAQQYAVAASLYRKIVTLQPNMMQAEVNLGLTLHLSGDLRGAIQCFENVLRSHPDLLAPNLLAGLDYLKLDNAERARPLLEKAVKQKPDQIESRVGLGNSYLQLGQYSEALEQFDRATELDPKNANAWYGLGVTYLSLEKKIEADLKRSTSPFRFVLLGQSYLEQGKTEKAIATLESAIALRPDVLCAHSILGSAYLRNSRFDDARRQFQLDWNPPSAEKCFLGKLGMVALAADRGDRDEAMQYLSEAAQLDLPFAKANLDFFANDLAKTIGEARTHEILAHYESAAAQNEAAIDSAVKGPSSACNSPSDRTIAAAGPEKLRSLSSCFFYSGRNAAVLSATDRLLKLFPNDPEALYWRIQSAEKLGLAALSRGTEINPDSASLHTVMGDMLRAKGDFASSAEEYRKAISVAPGFIAARLGLARALNSDRHAEESAQEVRAVLAANPDDAEANFLMGELLIDGPKPADALPFLTKALGVAPEELPYVHADLGKIYEEQGDAARAIEELKQAVTVDVDGSYNYRLGRLYLSVGNRAAAKAALAQSEKLRHATDAASLFEK